MINTNRTLSGLAIRQCIELGLHRKIPWTTVESNVVKTQIRRRVFWCSYNLDRAVAVTLGRPTGIADHDIDVEVCDLVLAERSRADAKLA